MRLWPWSMRCWTPRQAPSLFSTVTLPKELPLMGAIERNDGGAGELGVEESGLAAGRNDEHSFHVAAEHSFGFEALDGWVFVGGGNDGGVGFFFCDETDGVQADREEGVVQIGDDDADLAGALLAEGAGDLVGDVVELLDGFLDAEACFFCDEDSALE